MIREWLAGSPFWLIGVPYSALWGVVTSIAALLDLYDEEYRMSRKE